MRLELGSSTQLFKGLTGRVRFERQRMNLPIKLFSKDFIDRTVTFDPRLAGKGWRHNQYPEMTMSRPRRGAVPGVLFAFVQDVKTGRFQRNDQFFAHLLFNAQGFISMISPPGMSRKATTRNRLC